ncbi:unnamed protein product (macronuclear) [Paramecium tetraurelia]|uniref:MATE efflux family protein n=1 Tax=Paramecium tetraurelia TaxID=5888 RepID=A0DX34_PARTE|nr:uncharacterized protein GSPATT00021233001 [Paramecium tetraurelia]CAK87601.1 unnamed protein product [Paramecium tetraurelia]|eukprot:XP_001454998.1 hypothetical protein (macronuclear) [Paramecium tetraurelia strain d4-2]
MYNDNLLITNDWRSITYNVSTSMFQIVSGYICIDLMSMLNLHFMGQYTDKYQTASYGIAWMLIQLLFVPLGLGLVSHAIQVSTKDSIIRSHMPWDKISTSSHRFTQTSRFIPYYLYPYLFFYSFTILNTWFNSLYKKTLRSLHNMHGISNKINKLRRQMIIPLFIAAFLLLQIECLKQYLVGCRIFQPFPFIYASTLIFHLLACVFLFLICDLGYIGLCLSIILSELFTLFMLIRYIYKHQEVYDLLANFQFSCQIFQYKETYIMFVKESIPLILHIYADFIVFYILSFVAYSLGVNQANAQLAFANTSSIYFKFPISLSVTLMSYVGNSLSQHNIALAKQYIISGMGVQGVVLISLVIGLTIFQDQWSRIYSSDPQIQQIMLETLPYFLMGSVCFDGIQGALSGALKGVNKSTIVSNQTMISYYIIGIPVVLILAYVFHLELIGIWLGFGLCNLYLTIIYIYVLKDLNWNEQADMITQKLLKHEGCLGDIDLPLIQQQQKEQQ